MPGLNENIAAILKARTEEKKNDKGEVKAKRANNGTKLITLYTKATSIDVDAVEKGGYEMFMEAFAQEMAVLRQILCEGHEKFFTPCSARLMTAIIALHKSGEIHKTWTGKVSMLTWYLMFGNTKYDAKIESDLIKQFGELGVKIQ